MKRLLIVLAMFLLAFSSLVYADREVETYDGDFAFQGEKEVDISLDFSLGEFTVARARGDFIARIHGEYDKELFEVVVHYNNESSPAVLEIKIDKKGEWTSIEDDVENKWEVLLGDMVPLNIDIEGGMADTEFDFTGLQLSNLEMELGMASSSIIFNQPNPVKLERMFVDVGSSCLKCVGLGNANFEEFTIDCGMGSLEMDFSGKAVFEGEVTVDVGMGSLDVLLNPQFGNKIYCDKSLTSSLSISKREFTEIKNDVYQTDNFENSDRKLIFNVDMGMSSASFRYAQTL